MANFFYWIFKITSAHRLLAGLLLLAIIALAVLSASRLNFGENITAIMPKDEGVAKAGDVLEGFNMNRRIVVHVYSSTQTPDSLIAVSSKMATRLKGDASQYITDIKLTIPDSQIQELYDYYFQNLPFYLTAGDYEVIKARIANDGPEQAVKQVYKSLMSPMGVVTKDMLLKDPFSLTSFPLNRTRELQLDENFSLYKNYILTENRKHLVFFVALANPPNETDKNGELIQIVDKLTAELSTEKIKVEYFGAAAVAVANANRIKNDIYITISAALAGLFLFISLFYRKITTFFIVVTPGFFGGLMAVAVLSILKDEVSVISLGVGSVLLGITIDYALHFFTHAKKEKNLPQLFDDLTTPLLMSGVTTACAFFSLLFIRSSALQDLGLFAGVSVVAASLYTLIVLPHFIKRNEEQKTARANWVERFVGSLAAYRLYKNKLALLVIGILTILSFFTWGSASFESNMLGLNYMPERLAQYESNINQISNYSANNIYLASNGTSIWDALKQNQAIEEKLRKLQKDSLIYNYTTLNRVVPTLHEQKDRQQQWQQFWQRNDGQQLVDELNRKAEAMSFTSNTFEPFQELLAQDKSRIKQQDLDKLIDILGEDLLIKNADGSVSVLSTIKLPQQNKSIVLEQLEVIPGVIILDRGYITAKLVGLLQEDFNLLVNISLGVVFVILLMVYGRIELALITFLPILLSWLWVLGMMGLFGLQFNIVNIIICTFIFGLGIDYSIFVMRGLTQEYKYGTDNLISFKKSIILSAVTTLMGIGVLAFAQHPALKSIALLAIVGIVSVIVITFSVQPLIYNLFIGNRKKKGVVPFTIASFFLTIIAFSYFLFGCLILQLIRPIFLIPIGSENGKKRAYHWLMMLFCRTLIYAMANFKKKVVGKENVDYSKPAVIIANHHSFIDILIMLMFSPKVVIVTNDWVYYSPFFGKPVQYADFIHAAKGMETQLDKVKQLVKEGYSIAVFPEGTRTESFKLSRFHKGAFYLAEELKLDIQPMVLHGTNLVMPKGDDFYLKNNRTTITFLPRIKHDDKSFGEGYAERTKKISKYFKAEYGKIRREVETPAFFKEIFIKNYMFKGPILEWYIRVKFKMESQYQLFHEMIPADAKITDLGCGYGMMTYALALSGEKRQITGIDYDAKKIAVAEQCPVKSKSIRFKQGDVVKSDFELSDVFLLSDVLHYLTEEEQQLVLKKMADNLESNGMIIIRDGDSEKATRHKGTQLTEIFSTNFGFNKKRNKLNYISSSYIKAFAEENNFDLEVIDNTKRTSNTVFVLRK